MTPSTSTSTSIPPAPPLRLLVVGGTGNIGSHLAKRPPGRSCDVDTCDNLSTRRRDVEDSRDRETTRAYQS